MPDCSSEQVVIIEAGFLRNLVHIDRLDLLKALSDCGFAFVVPEAVIDEVSGLDDDPFGSDDFRCDCCPYEEAAPDGVLTDDILTDDVLSSDPDPARWIEQALRAGGIRESGPLDASESRSCEDHRSVLSRGEAACLALAESRGWIVASDEPGRFQRHLRDHLGEHRIMSTVDFLLLAIRRGILSVDDADGIRTKLRRHGFRMAFPPFRYRLGDPGADRADGRGAGVSIVVDAGEAACGLAELLAREWDDVQVRRLPAGDIAIGDRVLVERKTAVDYLASLADGRLFRQAFQLAGAVPRPLIILEGDLATVAERIHPASLRGVELAIAVGYRIPVLTTSDLADTVSRVRHIAAQEAKRKSRRSRGSVRTRGEQRGEQRGGDERTNHRRLPPEAFDTLLALPGVGKERARAIAESVGSLSDLCRLGVRDLLRVPGVGPDTAARIVDALRGTSAEAGSARGPPR